MGSVAGQPLPLLCGGMVLSVCDEPLAVPALVVGETATLTLPAKYVNRKVMVQCIKKHDAVYPHIIQNVDAAFCSLKTCKFSSVSLCGGEMPLAGEMQVDTRKKIAVPAELLVTSKPSRFTDPWFEAACVMSGDDPELRVVNTAGMSCNDFPCLAGTLDVCGEKVALSRDAALGESLQVMTEGNHPVTVQCLASGGNRPTYMVTDATNVPSCRQGATEK